MFNYEHFDIGNHFCEYAGKFVCWLELLRVHVNKLMDSK